MQSAEDLLRSLDPLERGLVIAVLRSARGMTKDKLAKRANVSPNTISDWEKGQVESPRELFTKLDPVLTLTPSNIRHALSLIRMPQRASEIAEGPAGPQAPLAGDESATEVRELTAPEIESELQLLSTRLGPMVVRILLLAAERAIRGAEHPAG